MTNEELKDKMLLSAYFFIKKSHHKDGCQKARENWKWCDCGKDEWENHYLAMRGLHMTPLRTECNNCGAEFESFESGCPKCKTSFVE